MSAVIAAAKAARVVTVALRVALSLVAALRLRLRAGERHDQGGYHGGGLQECLHDRLLLLPYGVNRFLMAMVPGNPAPAAAGAVSSSKKRCPTPWSPKST